VGFFFLSTAYAARTDGRVYNKSRKTSTSPHYSNTIVSRVLLNKKVPIIILTNRMGLVKIVNKHSKDNINGTAVQHLR